VVAAGRGEQEQKIREERVSEQPLAEAVPEAAAEPQPLELVPERRRALRAGLPASIQSLLATVVIAIFVITFLVQAFQIPSESMENTLLIGDYLLVDKVDYANGGMWGRLLPYSKIERGDIVVFHYPVHPDQHFVKRVIGVPGDHIRMNGKQVWVNGTPLKENYAIYRSAADDAYHYHFPNTDFVAAGVEARWWLQMRSLVHEGELVVPPGQYFVLGDNRDESLDSRFWGFVPRANIVGRPLLIYWSIRAPDEDNAFAGGPGDTLTHFAYILTHVFQATRWKRTFRLVN
jgi:signal peptidase I